MIALSDYSNVYLIDMLKLANAPALDAILTEIFSQSQTTFVGLSFKDLIQIFEYHFPEMSFFKSFENDRFIDVQDYYSKVRSVETKPSLEEINKTLFGQEICLQELNSNWIRRPLRQSQQHHAALNAYSLIEIVLNLSVETGTSVQDLL